MTAQLRSTEQLFDLSARVKFRVSGADRLRFLNGQLTNDVRKAAETNAVEACVLNAKGKMDAHLFLHVDGDSFLVDANPALRASLQPRLERYIIADDVQIEDVTEELSIFHALGQTPSNLPGEVRVLSVDRFGVSGHDIWIDAGDHDKIAAALARALEFCDESCA